MERKSEVPHTLLVWGNSNLHEADTNAPLLGNRCTQWKAKNPENIVTLNEMNYLIYAKALG